MCRRDFISPPCLLTTLLLLLQPSALACACERRDSRSSRRARIVKALLSQPGIDVNSAGAPSPPLVLAAANSLLDCVAALLTYATPPHTRYTSLCSPTQWLSLQR